MVMNTDLFNQEEYACSQLKLRDFIISTVTDAHALLGWNVFSERIQEVAYNISY